MKHLLEKGSILILLGTGGVGKTTIAAALGVAGAKACLATAIITVDPALRLRDALGLSRLGGSPTRLAADTMRAAGLDPTIELSAMQLDVKGAWDTMVERFTRSTETRRKILENPFYKNLTQNYAGSDAYAALQQLYDVHESKSFDFEIVDTPPAAHAFEFLQAPARLIRLLDSRTARWLFAPSMAAGRIAMRLASQAARFVVRELERFAGANVLSTISDFFIAASEAVDAMVVQLHKTETLLHSPRVHFILVTTAEEDRLRRASELITEMQTQGLRLSAIVINRFLEEETWPEAAVSASEYPRRLEGIKKLRPSLKRQIERSRGMNGVVSYLEEYRSSVLKDIARVRKFARELAPEICLAIAPEIEVGVQNLVALSHIGEYLLNSAFYPKGAPRDTASDRKSPANRGGH